MISIFSQPFLLKICKVPIRWFAQALHILFFVQYVQLCTYLCKDLHSFCTPCVLEIPCPASEKLFFSDVNSLHSVHILLRKNISS